MPQGYLVQLDLKKLRFNLSKADGRIYSEEELRQWLDELGMVETPQGWIAHEANIGNLSMSAIVRCRRIA